MKRYLAHYSTNEEYLADRKNLDLPNVSFIKEIESLAIHTKNYQIDIYDMAKTIVYDSPVKLSFSLPTDITIELDEYKNGRGVIIANTDIISIYSFTGHDQITSIQLPSKLESINSGLFSGCTSLQSIIIPDTVTSIGYSSFNGCISLQSVIIPDSVTDINSGTFSGCTSLQSIIIPDSVTDIGDGAFQGCTSLQSIIIPDSVTLIGSGAFQGCTSLETVTFEGDVENIRMYYSSFAGTPWYNNLGTETINGITYNTLNHITSFRPSQCDGTLSIKEGIKYIIAPDGIFNNMYLNVENITAIVLPDSLLTIDYNQFINYTNVTSVTIGSGVQNIRDYAFKDCTSLTTVTFNGEESEITMNEYKVFAGTPYLINKYPELIKITYTADNKLAETTSDKTAGLHTDRFGGLTIISHTFENGVGEIVFNSPVTTTGTYAFYGSQIKTITLPASIETIDNYAFMYSYLESITIPASVKYINDYAFANTSNLETVTYEGNESNINIYSTAFDSSLAKYNKPENKIIYEAPEKLTQLPQASTMYGNGVYLNSTNVSWWRHTFKDGVGTIIYTGPVNYLYGDLFVGEGITSVTLPPQLYGISAYAFYGCTTLTTVNYLGGMDNVNIVENAFYNSPYEETIKETTNGVTYYANKILRFDATNCDGNLVIKEGVKTIPYDMYGSQYFSGKSVITSVTIPESVTTIQDYAFSNCYNLITVTFVGNQENINIGEHAFTGTPYSYDKPENKIIYEAPEKLTQLPQASSMYGNGVYVYGTNVSYWSHTFEDGVGTITYKGPVNYLYGDLFVGEGITSVTLPSQLQGIGSYAFYGCTTLTTVNYLGGMDNVNIDENAFYNSPYEETIKETINGITYYVNKIIRFNDADCDGNLVIKEGVKTIPYDMYGSQYFKSKSVITSVTIPESVTTIQDYAFSGCSNLTTVTFIGNQENINIGEHAFAGTPYAESNS